MRSIPLFATLILSALLTTPSKSSAQIADTVCLDKSEVISWAQIRLEQDSIICFLESELIDERFEHNRTKAREFEAVQVIEYNKRKKWQAVIIAAVSGLLVGLGI